MCYSIDIKASQQNMELFTNATFIKKIEFQETIFANSSFNLRNKIPVILSNERDKIHDYYWGFVPRWYNPEKSKQNRPYHNARIETLNKLASFKPAVNDKNFCLLMATGFYEPNKLKDSKAVLFTIKDQPMFLMAGLWEKWKDFYTVTMVTCKGNEIVNQYHKAERMPIILSHEESEFWLNGNIDYFRNDYKLFPSEKMKAEKVG